MSRDIANLAEREFDILIVGGGIHGVTLAREAALAGLSVALVDKADFCSATSANSLKILHGGIRYLQQANLPRVRQSVIERRTMLQIAPHLVEPLPCAMPTYGHGMKGKEVMFCGLLAYNLLSGDRNQGLPTGKAIPSCRIGSRTEWLAIAPDLDNPRFTGAALWHDAIALNTERLGLGFVASAIQAGAHVANYIEVTGFQRNGRDVTGVTAIDRITNQPLTIRAKVTVNNTGPWIRETLRLLGETVTTPEYRCALAMNVVLRKQLIPRHAVGLTAYKEGWENGRLFFFVPWRDRTMVGTYLRPHTGSPDQLKVTPDDIQSFIANLNLAYPAAQLKPKDIAFIQAGLMPATDQDVSPGGEPRLLNQFQILDHAKGDNLNGLMSVLGVKWTTARDVAQRTLALLLTKLGRSPVNRLSAIHPLPGGDIPDLEVLIKEIIQSGLPEETAHHLVCHYGLRCRDVIRLGATNPLWLKPLGEGTCVTGAEIIFALREEMAQTLADVVLRRTGLGSAGRPSKAALMNAAVIMARELAWDAPRLDKELAILRALPCWPVEER
ncbi:MAG: glycerol-3-phosphate dehydrogenase/oxidase [bacterium]